MTEEAPQRRIDEIGDESRRRILDAAEELFAERGYDRTSFVDIAARSGISRGSIPWHFKNKDGLTMAVIERSIKRAVSRDRYVADGEEQTLPSLGAVLSDYARYLQESNPRLLFMSFTAVMGSDGSETLRQLYRDFLAQQRSDLQDWFRVQRPDGLDRSIASAREKSLSAVILAALTGIQLQWQIDPDVDLSEFVATLAALVDGHVDDLWTGVPKERKASARARPRSAGRSAKESGSGD